MAARRRLRVWADAVCINQPDVAERNAQVRNMRDIFRRCEEVWVWLGPPDATSVQLVRAAQSVGTSQSLTPDAFDAIVALQERRWFWRKWVVQEFAVAPEASIWLGPQRITWSEFYALRNQFWRSQSELWRPGRHSQWRRGLTNMNNLIDYRYQYANGHRSELHDLLLDTRGFDTSDERDQLFSMLGLAKELQGEHEGLLEPDYGVDFVEVCIRHARWHLERRSLRFLECVAADDTLLRLERLPGQEGLPSWVPRLDRYRGWLAYRNYFAASGDRKFEGANVDGANRLSIKGIRIDVIAELAEDWWLEASEAERRGETRSPLQRILRECQRVAFPDGDRDANGGIDAFWRTLVCERNVVESSSRSRATPDSGQRVLELLDIFAAPDAPQTLSELPPEQIDRFNDIAKCASALRFCRMAGGRLGQTQRMVQPGGVVAVFFGARLPFVLRPQKDGTFVFLGHCYVHGLMDGEALSIRGEEETFVIV